MDTIFLILSSGLDSFVACFGIGAILVSWRERLQMAMAFGIWDAAS